MKQAEIEKGKSYSNGKGRIRRVVDIGPQYKLYAGQLSSDNLRYEIIQDGGKHNSTAGTQSNISVHAFAIWAKEVVG